MRPLPDAMVPVAATYRPPPVPALDSATVILVRDGEGGLEVYLQRRQRSMNFAAGMYVFPGGGVHSSDADDIGWLGPEPDFWADRLRCDPQLASSLVVAATRELFEETGVLLAGADSTRMAAAIEAAALDAFRGEVERGERSFSELLAERGLGIRTDLLVPWAHWITPEFQPRRYDTRFFVAAMPTGQEVGSISGEADRGGWILVEDALAAVTAGEMAMMPPTRHTCRSLVGSTVADLLRTGSGRRVETIEPRLVERAGRYYLDRPSLDEVT